MEFNARLEYQTEATPEHAEQLVDALSEFSPAASPSDLGRLEAWITLHANTAHQAARMALALAHDYPHPLIAFEILPTDEFDRRSESAVPDLLSAPEAAEKLGISRQAVLQQFDAGKLPGKRVGERTIVFAADQIDRLSRDRQERIDARIDATIDRLVITHRKAANPSRVARVDQERAEY